MSLRLIPNEHNNPVQQSLPAQQPRVDPKKADRLRSNGLRALRPVFQQYGPAYKQPLAYRRDLGPARQRLGKLRELVRGRRADAQQKLDNTWCWRVAKKRTRETDLSAVTVLDSHLSILDAAALKLNNAQHDYTYLRNQPIPLDAVARQQHLQKLRQASLDFENASQVFQDQLKLLDKSAATHTKRLGLFAWSAKRAIRDHVADFKEQLAETYKSADASASFRVTIAQDRSRIDELEQRLNNAANQGNLSAILGDPADPTGPKLSADLALQALRSGEAIGPDLKYALDDTARTTNLTELGAGSRNTVLRASYRVPGSDHPIDYALKPLDTQKHMAGAFPKTAGLSYWQTRTYSRHAAAHQLSKTLGYDLVDEPRFAKVEGRLHLALPVAQGHSPNEMKQIFYMHNTGPDFDLPKKIMRELHLNQNLQNEMKNVQNFQALIGNLDGHADNLKLLFTDENGKTVTPRDMAKWMKRGQGHKIRSLRVKAKLFDLDPAFPARVHTVKYIGVRQSEALVNTKKRKVVKVPVLGHNLGMAPFHDTNDKEKLDQLREQLKNGDLRRELGWYLTGGRQGADRDEMNALRLRARDLREAYTQQRKSGRRIDHRTGQLVQRKARKAASKPKKALGSSGNPQKEFSDAAPRVLTFHNEDVGYTEVRSSLMHRFFPRSG